MHPVRQFAWLALASLVVDLGRQALMRQSVRLEVAQKDFSALGLAHPSLLPARQRLLVFLTLGSF